MSCLWAAGASRNYANARRGASMWAGRVRSLSIFSISNSAGQPPCRLFKLLERHSCCIGSYDDFQVFFSMLIFYDILNDDYFIRFTYEFFRLMISYFCRFYCWRFDYPSLRCSNKWLIVDSGRLVLSLMRTAWHELPFLLKLVVTPSLLTAEHQETWVGVRHETIVFIYNSSLYDRFSVNCIFHSVTDTCWSVAPLFFLFTWFIVFNNFLNFRQNWTSYPWSPWLKSQAWWQCPISYDMLEIFVDPVPPCDAEMNDERQDHTDVENSVFERGKIHILGAKRLVFLAVLAVSHSCNIGQHVLFRPIDLISSEPCQFRFTNWYRSCPEKRVYRPFCKILCSCWNQHVNVEMVPKSASKKHNYTNKVGHGLQAETLGTKMHVRNALKLKLELRHHYFDTSHDFDTFWCSHFDTFQKYTSHLAKELIQWRCFSSSTSLFITTYVRTFFFWKTS